MTGSECLNKDTGESESEQKKTNTNVVSLNKNSKCFSVQALDRYL